jgi:hypothetical protein
MVLYRNTQQDLFDIVIPVNFVISTKEKSHYLFIFKELIYFLNKYSKPTTQLFCVDFILYRKRDSNSQNVDSKSTAYANSAISAFSGSNKICTYSVLKHLFYRQARLSHFGVLPFCLRSRIRTCNLPRPRRVNNQSLSSQLYN